MIPSSMQASLQNAAQLTVFVEADVTEMVALRANLLARNKKNPDYRLSYNDIICYAVCRALLKHPIMHIPGIKVVIPSTPYDAKGLLIEAIRDDNPVAFLEHKMLYGVDGEVPDESYTIPFGKADIKREGTDVTVVATSLMVHTALAAAEKLAGEGISVEVVDPRTLVPLDTETIFNSVKKTHSLVIAHEAVGFAGAGAEIAAEVAENVLDYLDAPIKRVAAPFAPVPFSPPLEQAYIPSADDIIAAVKAVKA